MSQLDPIVRVLGVYELVKMLSYWVLFALFVYGVSGVGAREKGDRLPALEWMHIPKTSSWMGDFLFMYACPHLRPAFDATNNEEFFFELMKDNTTEMAKCDTKILPGVDGGFGWHSPYLKENSNGTTVTLFRRPRNRLISAFLFNAGMMIPPGHLYSVNESYQPEIFKYIRNSEYPIMTYANYMGIPSCQTKMVLGHNCGTEVPLTEEDLAEAKRRVTDEFAFVGKGHCFLFTYNCDLVLSPGRAGCLIPGLTEESAASAKLFYAMFGREIEEPAYKPYARLYRVNDVATKEERAKLMKVLHDQKWSDPPEQALYQHVRKLFYKRCEEYGIPTLERYDHSRNIY